MQKLLNDKRVTTFVDTWEFQHPSSACFPYDARESNQKTDASEVSSYYKTDHVRIFPVTDFGKPKYAINDSLNFGQFENYVSMHWLLARSKDFTSDFDYIIRLRPDTYLLSDIVYAEHGLVSPGCGWIDDKYAFSDIFFHGNRESMHKVCSFHDVIDDYLPNDHMLNWHEKLFNRYIENCNVAWRVDQNMRFQIKRPGFPAHYSVGFFDSGGGLLEVPRI